MSKTLRAGDLNTYCHSSLYIFFFTFFLRFFFVILCSYCTVRYFSHLPGQGEPSHTQYRLSKWRERVRISHPPEFYVSHWFTAFQCLYSCASTWKNVREVQWSGLRALGVLWKPIGKNYQPGGTSRVGTFSLYSYLRWPLKNFFWNQNSWTSSEESGK